MMRSRVSLSIIGFLFFVLLCSTGANIPISAGTIKYSQIGFFVFAFFNLRILNVIKDGQKVDKWVNISIIVLLVIAIGSLLYSVDRNRTLIQSLQLIINVLIFYSTIGFLSLRNNGSGLAPLLTFVFYVFIVLALFEYLGLIMPENDNLSNGLFGGRKAGLFMADSNWNSTYVFFLYYALYLYYKKGYIRKQSFSVIAIGMGLFCLLTLSRVILLAYFIHVVFSAFEILPRKWLLPLIILGYIILMSPIPRMILPERYTYDIYDDSSNPRYLDAIFLIDEVSVYGKERMGFGFGTLSYVNDDIRNSFRGNDFEYAGSINVLPVQLYFDFGLIGLGVLSFLLILLIAISKSWDKRFIIIASYVFCCFHMPGYMNFFWLFMGYFYYLFNLLDSKIDGCYI